MELFKEKKRNEIYNLRFLYKWLVVGIFRLLDIF